MSVFLGNTVPVEGLALFSESPAYPDMYGISIVKHAPWWRHQMKTFSALLTICGKSPVTGEFPAQRPMTRSFDVFFDLRLNKRLSNGDLRHHRAHYDVTVMLSTTLELWRYQIWHWNLYQYIVHAGDEWSKRIAFYIFYL